MARIYSLIIAVLSCLPFASFAAGAAESCQEMRVPDRKEGAGDAYTQLTGTGWKLTKKEAYTGSTYKQHNSCYDTLSEVVDNSDSDSCNIMVTQTKHNKDCPGENQYNHPPAWASCAASGFPLQTRMVNQDDVQLTIPHPSGYLPVDLDTGSQEYLDSLGPLIDMGGLKVCHEGKQHIVKDVVKYVWDEWKCYEINKRKYCEVIVTFNAQPTCGKCDGSELDKDKKPGIPDTDGDGQPDDTDPDVDGDGQPNDTDPDPGNPGGGGDPGGGGSDPGGGDPGGGDPGGSDPGGGGSDPGGGCHLKPGEIDTDGDCVTDDKDPDDDGDGCLDVDEPCKPPDNPGGGGNGNGDNGNGNGDNGNGNGDDDGNCDPKKEKCDNGSGFGGSCAAGFTCSGDAVQCAIAREVHLQGCRWTQESDESKLYGREKGKDGNQTGSLAGNATEEIQGKISKADALGGGQGLSDLTVTVMGKQITIPFSSLNKYLAMMGNILVAVALLVALKIIVI